MWHKQQNPKIVEKVMNPLGFLLYIPLDEEAEKLGLTEQQLRDIRESFTGGPKTNAHAFWRLYKEGKFFVYHDLIHRIANTLEHNTRLAIFAIQPLRLAYIYPCAFNATLEMLDGDEVLLDDDMIDVVGTIAMHKTNEIEDVILNKLQNKMEIEDIRTALDETRPPKSDPTLN